MTIISGIVHDSSGRPVAQARVYFMSGPAALQDISALTDDDGVFALSTPSDGIYQIGLAADDLAPTSITVAVQDRLEVKLRITLKAIP